MADIGPWPFDILTRIIRVVKSRGVFVAAVNGMGEIEEGDISHASVWRDDGTDERTNWQKVADLGDEFNTTWVYGGAFGLAGGNPALGIPPTPTFILCGYAEKRPAADEPPSPDNLQQLIWTSTNGNTWTQSKRGSSGTLYLAAWDENRKKFCVEGFNNADDTYDVFESSDGLSWTNIASLPPENPVSPVMEATGTTLIRDGEGHIVPYGSIYGWNQGTIWITPNIIDNVYRQVWESVPNTVEVIERTVDPETGAVTVSRSAASVPMKYVVSVANSGDVWNVGGYEFETDEDGFDFTSVIAMSTDAGASWQTVYGNQHEWVGCIIAGDPAPN